MHLAKLGDCVSQAAMTGIAVALLSMCFLAGKIPVAKADAADLPVACQQACATPFGKQLGVSPTGVAAYSNCSEQCVFPQPVYTEAVFTGIQWQCVEYARRWLLVNQRVVFGDVDIAADIWGLTSVTEPNSNTQHAFESIVNGSDPLDIAIGDLLIFAQTYLGTGHVAVVSKVHREAQFVEVVEQNFANQSWLADYARKIPFVVHDGRMWLLDPHLIGWKRVSKTDG